MHYEAEVAFWREWLTADRFAAERSERIAGLQASFPRGFAAAVGATGLLRVLDVGSGPISTLPLHSADGPMELICVDPLADAYNELLEGFDVPRIESVKAEELSSRFGPEFDYVHCANALDHCEDPARAFEEMWKVCRPGGLVSVVSVENEGRRQHYEGLHQWDLRADDQGLWLGDRNLLEGRDPRLYDWRYVAEQPDGARVFLADIGR
jgi:SAM-dependent methyltransferase